MFKIHAVLLVVSILYLIIFIFLLTVIVNLIASKVQSRTYFTVQFLRLLLLLYRFFTYNCAKIIEIIYSIRVLLLLFITFELIYFYGYKYSDGFRLTIIIYSVLYTLKCNHTFSVVLLSLFNNSFNLVCDSFISTITFVYANSLIAEFWSLIPFWNLIIIFHITFSSKRLNRMGDMESPNLKPDFIATGPNIVFPTLNYPWFP